MSIITHRITIYSDRAMIQVDGDYESIVDVALLAQPTQSGMIIKNLATGNQLDVTDYDCDEIYMLHSMEI